MFEPGFGFEQCVRCRRTVKRLRLTARAFRCRYVDYVLDVPMYFVYRDGNYIDASGQSFRDFLDGKLPAYPGHRPDMGDWEAHLTTVFPEVRLKRFLEMRGADNGPWRSICSLPALWVRIPGSVNQLRRLTRACRLACSMIRRHSTRPRRSSRTGRPRSAPHCAPKCRAWE